MSYESIKTLAAAQSVPMSSLLALSEDNDPFFAGRPAAVADAQWFAGIWQRFGFADGVHLRRIHYKLVAVADVTLRNGEIYQNTERCWDRLQMASKAARYLNLVDPAAFVDRRAPDPRIFARYRDFPAEPESIIGEPVWRLPEISVDLNSYLALPTVEVSGYDYSLADQLYHLVLFVEKSTMDDVLVPVCARFGVDLITGVGFASVTSVIGVLRRTQSKPLRVFYISDFDPAGTTMPISVARQAEFWRDHFAPGSDIKLKPLALTREQVLHYRLPRVPIKDSDSRKRGFEDRNGTGAVELDALEALYPGELARLVAAGIAPYFDDTLEEQLAETEAEAAANAEAEWDAATADISEELGAIRSEAKRVISRFKPRAQALASQFDEAMKPLRRRLNLARQAVRERAGGMQFDFPVRPDAATANDVNDWLFDSDRDYLEQLDAYQRHKNGQVKENDQ